MARATGKAQRILDAAADREWEEKDKLRQLEAEVVYAHGTQGTRPSPGPPTTPRWRPSPRRAWSPQCPRHSEIVALSKEGSKNGTPVMETYQLTVTKQGASSADDVLSLSATTVTTSGGQYVDRC